MGVWRSGLKNWVQAVSKWPATCICSFSSSSPVLDKYFNLVLPTFILGLCAGLNAGVGVNSLSPFQWFSWGLANGVGLMFGWKWMIKRRKEQRATIAGNVEHFLLQSCSPQRGYEAVDWLNRLIEKAWPYLASTLELERPMLRAWIEPLLEEYRLGVYEVIQEQPDIQRIHKYIPVEEVISSLHLNDISMGKIAPKIEGLKIHTEKDGNIIFGMRVKWEGDVGLTLGVGTTTGVIPIVLEKLKILATIRLIVQIVDSIPIVAAVVATLPIEQKPATNYMLKVLESSSTVLPNVTKELQNLISGFIFHNLFWPQRLVYKLYPKEAINQDLKLHGQLSVAIIKGKDLINLYPYVIVYCRQKFKVRTKSLENTHDPVWNEEFTLNVEDQESQNLVLQVMNETKGVDEFVGVVVYPLKNLAPDKDMEVELAVCPTTTLKDGDKVGLQNEQKYYGILTVEFRYYIYTKEEELIAMQDEKRLLAALAAPDEEGSYATILDLIHP